VPWNCLGSFRYTFSVNRAQLLRRGVASGALLAAGPLVATAGATPPDGDLAALRIVIATELLKLDFATTALVSGNASSKTKAFLKRMHEDDAAHYEGLASLFAGAGQTAATAGDIDFSYPAKSFGSNEAIAKLAATLAATAVGAYLGAVGDVQTARFRRALAQISANEAQQASAAAQLLGRPLVGAAFAPALTAGQVTTVLDLYES
jgi:hypothetical protein